MAHVILQPALVEKFESSYVALKLREKVPNILFWHYRTLPYNIFCYIPNSNNEMQANHFCTYNSNNDTFEFENVLYLENEFLKVLDLLAFV